MDSSSYFLKARPIPVEIIRDAEFVNLPGFDGAAVFEIDFEGFGAFFVLCWYCIVRVCIFVRQWVWVNRTGWVGGCYYIYLSLVLPRRNDRGRQ